MGLPRTFIGFSSTDIHRYRMMLAWKENEHIDFNFTDCQLSNEINSENESYIKKICKGRINMAGKYIMLIGDDTKSKHKYVRWEAEVAIEKGCTITGVNLDKSKKFNEIKTPKIIQNIGAIFVPYSPKIIAYALNNYSMQKSSNYYYPNEIYNKL